MHSHLSTFNDSTCMSVGKEGAVRNAQLDLRLATAFGAMGTCGEWAGGAWGVSWGGDLPTHPASSPLCLLYEEPTFRSVNKTYSASVIVLFLSKLFLSVRLESAAVWRRDLWIWAHSAVGIIIIFFNLSEKPDLNMPRSFLVKKYFSNKKPYYRESQLESQTGKFFFLTDWLNLMHLWLHLTCWVNHSQSGAEQQTRTDPCGR